MAWQDNIGATPAWVPVTWGETVEIPKEKKPKGPNALKVLNESQARAGIFDNKGRRVLSATLLEAFSECERKFIYKYLEGEEESDKGSPILGTKVHGILEAYLKHGTYPDLGESISFPDKRTPGKVNVYYPGQIAESGLYLLPPPGTVNVEEAFTLETKESSWKGRKDGEYIIPLYVWEGVEYAELVTVLDHKTTSGARVLKTLPYGPYGKAPLTETRKGYKGEYVIKGLADDIQAILYCYEACLRNDVTHVLARWIYYYTGLTGKRDAWSSEYLFSREELERKIELIDIRAKVCQEVLASGITAAQAQPDTSACDNFGGCGFHQKKDGPCILSVGQIVSKGKGDRMVDVNALIAELEAKQNAAQGAPALPQSAPALPGLPGLPSLPGLAPSLPVQAPYWRPGMPLNAVQTYLKGAGQPWSVIAGQADIKPPGEVAAMYDSAYDSAGNQVMPGTNPGFINPPEAPHLAPMNPGMMPAVMSMGQVDRMVDKATTPTALVPAVEAVDELTALTDREQVKAYGVSIGAIAADSRLRLDGCKLAIRAHWLKHGKGTVTQAMPNEAPALTPALVEQVRASVPAGGPSPEELTARFGGESNPNHSEGKLGTGANGFILYVNCIPIKGGQEHATHLDSLLKDSGVLEQTSKMLGGIGDYRLADFGKGAGVLTTCLDAFLSEQGWGASVAIFVDSRQPEGRDCMATLTRHASMVVRGL